ncbi:response regulator [Belnapia sp. T18]|uniref:Response regulator n=1 Tax=Belnapia arida TaxID=2804533 RepID=A0ABS1UDL4_9PROT|nr:response regulator [Belnapia arida]MBL6082754.1 response regulator [Belnapia arida]
MKAAAMFADGALAFDQAGEGSQATRPVILVVEDQALIAILIGDIIQAAGYDAVFAHSGEAALAMAKTVEHLSAVITDIHLMHGIDGRSVLRHLRKSNPRLPAVVVTGFENSAPEADLRGLGGPTARLVKPFDCDELLASLAGVLSSTDGRAPKRTESGLTARRGERPSFARF